MIKPSTVTRREVLVTAAATPIALLASTQRAHGQQRARQSAAEHRLHHGRRYGLCRRVLLRPARIHHRQHRSAGGGGHAVPASLRELGRMLGDSHGLDHGPLSVPPADWSRRTAERTKPRQSRVASRASDAAFAAQESWIRNDTDRQVAPGLAAQLRAVEERLRSFLGISRRLGRLLHA